MATMIYAWRSEASGKEWLWRWRWVALALALLVVAATEIMIRRRRRRRRRRVGGNRVPTPGWGYVPFFGHLLLLLFFSGGLPHRWFHKLSRKHGSSSSSSSSSPFLLLWLGRVPVLVVSSAAAARLILHDHDIQFASRPSTSASRLLLYGPSDLVFSPYGPYWRKVKELMVTHFFNATRMRQFSPIRAQELACLISSIHAHRSTPQQIRTKLFAMAVNNVSRMALGSAPRGRDFSLQIMKMARDVSDLLGAFNIGDFLPGIGALDLQGYERQIKQARMRQDEILQRVIEDRRRELMEQGKVKDGTTNIDDAMDGDFLDVLLFHLDHGMMDGSIASTKDDCIKAIILDFFTAGTETTSSTIEWGLSELLRNKEIMMELQEELDNVLGKGQLVQESHIANLPFLQAVVKETLRLHVPIPLLIPHETMSACEVDGYHIPMKTRALVNAWAISRDENVWEEPFDFRPHRFLHSTMDVKGHHYELLPFGAGRRICPAMNLGLLSVQLVLAALVHSFEWSLPNDVQEIDMNEKNGLGLPKAKPLMVMAKPRLSKECYEGAL